LDHGFENENEFDLRCLGAWNGGMVTKTFLPVCLLSFAFSAPIFGQISAQATAKPPYGRSPTPSPSPKPRTAPRERPLAAIIKEVKEAVDKYQESLGGGKSALPPLQSAEFDFKVVTEDNKQGGISLFIFSFGASTANSTVNDVTYTYELPQPGAKALSEEPPVFNVLVSTIQEAARAVKESGAMGDLKFTKLVVEIQFGVKWTVDIKGNFTYQFVTLNLGAGKSNNTVQSVKLTFKEPEKQKPTPTPCPTITP
jgi:hypothetical protein